MGDVVQAKPRPVRSCWAETLVNLTSLHPPVTPDCKASLMVTGDPQVGISLSFLLFRSRSYFSYSLLFSCPSGSGIGLGTPFFVSFWAGHTVVFLCIFLLFLSLLFLICPALLSRTWDWIGSARGADELGSSVFFVHISFLFL
ncbi:hypothetical protein B0H63DRAFT_256431 [Podospora didyma]|uniref:Uncharacterized protein n=1 Tax=Podospora didyma TaxID=330526 RepID=A0AAE0KDM9_9PEZI|nr:hypothetical protein B0H63DRAFT_256431 [Podospora didyma]